MKTVATLLRGPTLIGGIGLAALGLYIHIAAYTRDVPEVLLSFAVTLGFLVAILGAPGGWVLQGGFAGFAHRNGWGEFRGWPRRMSVAIGLSVAFLTVTFVAMMLQQTPAAFARHAWALFAVTGLALASGAWFQLTTPVERWTVTCEAGHPTPAYRTRCGRCGAALSHAVTQQS